ncbi:hypothetical protein I7I50_07597 [Histoplasma capsulatum G186AR]|uniref:Uncharacterized protein n=1 Tax=Ajellomyces capsulatus TaxID=5037 RepID=A0A8H8D458_AJECA|nr:hypothetical protein I7I52_09331 [Histoplasma capsulatum]QSS68247.1 hypothetical protein I7I50_07597 [Histoplasma capsulatum G186AR]
MSKRHHFSTPAQQSRGQLDCHLSQMQSKSTQTCTKIPAYFTINTWLRNEMHRDLLGIGIDLVKSGFTTNVRVLSCMHNILIDTRKALYKSWQWLPSFYFFFSSGLSFPRQSSIAQYAGQFGYEGQPVWLAILEELHWKRKSNSSIF